MSVAPPLPTSAEDLAVLYDHPAAAPGSCYVRANMVCSLDGAISVDGRSGGLGSSGDKAVFTALRGVADVVLVAAGTVAAEDYGAAEPNPDFVERRAERGQAAAPVLAVVTGRLSLDPGSAVARAPGTIVLTCETAPEDRRRALEAAGAEVVDCGRDSVDLAAGVKVLAEKGLSRVLCEGGPSLLGSVVAAGLLDELCLTTSPTLVAGDGGRILHTASETDVPMVPVHVRADDEGFLYTRWRRPRVPA